MANTLSEALFVSTSWITALDYNNLTSQPTSTLVKDFLEVTLKSDKVSNLYCTVLDVEISEEQVKDAESVGVTLIPATRIKLLEPAEDQPGVHWLTLHSTYYPQLKYLCNVKHVVSFTQNTKNAAAAIQKSLFPKAELHQLLPPEPNGVLFTFDIWNKDACGLAGFHRTLIHNFCLRKARIGEQFIAYSTVLDIELSEDQRADAKKCGVTLIHAQRKTIRGIEKKDLPKVDWLLQHDSHYPDLRKLKNIKYVVGYIPKTGWAAATIRERLFPSAKLVLINHVLPEKNCILEIGDQEDEDFEEEMLKVASIADVLFSIGPKIYGYFKNAYRANINGRQLSDIPHEEILPIPGQVYFDSVLVIETESTASTILTYGQLHKLEALETCGLLVESIGNVAKRMNEYHIPCPDWKVYGLSEENADKATQFLSEKLNNGYARVKHYSTYSATKLLHALQQSHLCLPPSCYTDYSFEGLEAVAAGLPTRVQDDSHIAALMEKYFPEHFCNMEYCETYINDCILKCLHSKTQAFHHARLLKEDFMESNEIKMSAAKFSSVFKEEKRTEQSDTWISESVRTRETTTVCLQAMETTKLQPGMSITGLETVETTATRPEITVTEDMDITENIAVHFGMAVTEVAAAVSPSHSQSIVDDIICIEGTSPQQSTSSQQPGDGVGYEPSVMEKEDAGEIHIDADDINQKSRTMSTETLPDNSYRERNQGISQEILETELKQAKTENATLEERCKELTQKLESSEQSFIFQRIGERQKLQSELEEKTKLVWELQDKVEKLEQDKDRLIEFIQDEKATISTAPEDSTDFVAHVQLTEESYEQQMRDLDIQYQTRSVVEKKLKLKFAWEKSKAELDKHTDDIISLEALHKMSGEGMKAQTAMKKRLTHTCKTAIEQDKVEVILHGRAEEWNSHQLPSGFHLLIPPCAVEEDTKLVVTRDNTLRPPVRDYEFYQSDVLHFDAGNITLKKPVYLVRKHLSISSLKRTQIVLMSRDGKIWKELKSFEGQASDSIKVEVTHLCNVSTISRPYQYTFRVDKRGGLLKSETMGKICLDIPKDAVEGVEDVILEVHDDTRNDNFIRSAAETFNISFGSIIYVNRTPAKRVSFKKGVTINIPVPPPIRDVPPGDTEVHIFKDVADSDEWQVITGDSHCHIEDDVVKFTIEGTSGYTVGRCATSCMLAMCNILSNITKFMKSGEHRVQIYLLQHKLKARWLRCDIVEKISPSNNNEFSIHEKHPSFINPESEAGIIIRHGDVIENTTCDNFKLESEKNQKTYYPYDDNHWDVLVTPTKPLDDDVIGRMKFKTKSKILAELMYTIPTPTMPKIDSQPSQSSTQGDAAPRSSDAATNQTTADTSSLMCLNDLICIFKHFGKEDIKRAKSYLVCKGFEWGPLENAEDIDSLARLLIKHYSTSRDCLDTMEKILKYIPRKELLTHPDFHQYFPTQQKTGDDDI